MAGASDGDGAFLHRLQECGLCAGCCPVDFIREDQLRENGTLLEFKMPSAVIVFNEEHCACDIRRHYVRRELDAFELEVECFAECIDELRFA